jgi:hypothetical protein
VSDSPFQSLDELSQAFPNLRRKQKLHQITEKRLALLLKDIYPDAHPKTEPGEMPGGRPDLALYFGSGHYAVFEIFATVSQVAQDLRHLEQSSAQARIAILTDPALDDGIFEEYFRKRARDPFPWVKLSDILVVENEASVKEQLKQLIDEAFVSTRDAVELSPRYQELGFRERQKKRDALRDFLANDVEIFGSSVVGAFYHGMHVPSMLPLAKRLDKAISKTKTLEMIFITDETIRKSIVGMGDLGRLAWDQRIDEEKIDLFFEHKERLENALRLLEEELTGLHNLVDVQKE